MRDARRIGRCGSAKVSVSCDLHPMKIENREQLKCQAKYPAVRDVGDLEVIKKCK